MYRALPAFLLMTSCSISSGNGNSSVTSEQTDCVKPDRGYNNGPIPDWCGKIEGGDIGHATTITASVSITITSWIPKDDSPDEWIGFTYTPTVAPGVITIKASTEVYEEDGDGIWIHPGGTFG